MLPHSLCILKKVRGGIIAIKKVNSTVCLFTIHNIIVWDVSTKVVKRTADCQICLSLPKLLHPIHVRCVLHPPANITAIEEESSNNMTKSSRIPHLFPSFSTPRSRKSSQYGLKSLVYFHSQLHQHKFAIYR